MFLKTLFLRNFRSYDSFKIEFSPNINVICGENGIGKTNLLEAIYLISTGKSFRTTIYQDIIKQKKSFFYVEALLENNDLTQTIKIYYDGKSKKISIDGSEYNSFTKLLGNLYSSLHTSDDINLIKGKPINKRSFLNYHLAQLDPLYVHHYHRFAKAIKQRNLLLKQNNTKFLKSYDIELSKSGSYIFLKRKEFIDSLKKPLDHYIQKLTNNKFDTSVNYLPSFEVENDINLINQKYLNELKKNQSKELIFKTTLIGPHRDDFSILFNKKVAKRFASEGQKKLSLYALKFAQWEILSSLSQEKPIFLIDDFDIYLDKTHKNNLKEELNSFAQVFLTIPKTDECFGDANIINIR